jgi:endoglucanase
MKTDELLFALSRLNGPPGFEEEAASYCAAKLGDYSRDIRRDVMGNVIARIPCGKAGAKKVMLDAHIDELGLIISAVEEGYLRFEVLGGIDARMLPGREVSILTEPPIFGVVSCLPPHVLTAEQMEKPIAVKDMYIDVGLSDEKAKERVPVGTPAVYRDSPRMLENRVFTGKAVDDRASFAAIIFALEELKNKKTDVDLIVVAGVQEEVLMRGAGPAAYAVEPDYAIVVDVTHADTPDSKGQTHCKQGGGPSISIGPNTNRKFSAFIQRRAQSLGIPFQLGVHTRNSCTNAHPIQVTRAGITTALVEIPARYLHSPVECVKLDDIENTGRLLAAAVEAAGKEESL